MAVPRYNPNLGGQNTNPLSTTDFADFTGGLNLDPNEFRLEQTESPEMLNVDISHRGGVEHRKGYIDHVIAIQGSGGSSSADSIDLHAWYGQSGFASPDGAVIVSVTGLEDSSPRISFFPLGYDAGMHGYEFGQNQHTARWTQRRSMAEFYVRPTAAHPDSARNGTTVFAAADNNIIEMWIGQTEGPVARITSWPTGMTTNQFNADLDNPVNDRVPAASCVASWQGSLWVADILELGERRPTRLRWSHPNYPKDWHPDHWIDLGDDSAGKITALVPDGDRLLVFRERAIHAIVGAPPTGLQAYLVTDTLGCDEFKKIAATEHGVYFWADERGVFQLSGSKIKWVGEPLSHALETGRMRGDERGELSWGGDRLYVKVEYDGVNGEDTYDSWFVYDPTVGKRGAWTQHAFITEPGEPLSVRRYKALPDQLVAKIGKSLWFDPPNQEPHFVVAFENPPSQPIAPWFSWGTASSYGDQWTTLEDLDESPFGSSVALEFYYQHLPADAELAPLFNCSASEDWFHASLAHGWGELRWMYMLEEGEQEVVAFAGLGVDGAPTLKDLVGDDPFKLRIEHDLSTPVMVEDDEDGLVERARVSFRVYDENDILLWHSEDTAQPFVGPWVPSVQQNMELRFTSWMGVYAFKFSDGLVDGEPVAEYAFTADDVGGETYTDHLGNLWEMDAVEVTGTWYTAPGLVVRARDSAEDRTMWTYTTGLRTNKASFRTSWHDLNEPGVQKRWRRFDIVGSGLDDDQTLDFEGYTDWDATRRRRRGVIDLNYPRSGGVWGESQWGEFEWGEAALPISVVARTPPMGRARAVQLRFIDTCEPQELDWAINSIVAKYKLYPTRG